MKQKKPSSHFFPFVNSHYHNTHVIYTLSFLNVHQCGQVMKWCGVIMNLSLDRSQLLLTCDLNICKRMKTTDLMAAVNMRPTNGSYYGLNAKWKQSLWVSEPISQVKTVSNRAGRYKPKWYEETFISVDTVHYHHKCQIIISFKCQRWFLVLSESCRKQAVICGLKYLQKTYQNQMKRQEDERDVR